MDICGIRKWPGGGGGGGGGGVNSLHAQVEKPALPFCWRAAINHSGRLKKDEGTGEMCLKT